MIRLTAGELRLTLLEAGHVWLDGGAMFGVVPKPLWERHRKPDARNRIRLAMNLLLIEDGKHRILIDSGAGDKWDEKSADIYALPSLSAETVLAPAGLGPDQIDVVINTHLHFDHAGGNTERRGGAVVAAFPNAEYVVQRGELDIARWDNERIRASYLRENFDPLAESGRIRTVEGDCWFRPYLELRVAPGHTPHMQIAVVHANGRRFAFMADLVPTASHVPYPWIMGYDLEPLATLATKKRILPEAVRDEWNLIFEHDDTTPLGTLAESNGRLGVTPAEVER